MGDEFIQSFNCAGLATRTFAYMGLDDLKKRFLSKGKQIPCKEKCVKCQIKFWLWEYKLHIEYVKFGILRKTQPNSDFHVVSGRVSCKDGSDLANVFSKNGARAIKGPGLGSNFKPAVREQRRENNAQEKLQYYDMSIDNVVTYRTQSPLIGVRTNIKESCYCVDIKDTEGK